MDTTQMFVQHTSSGGLAIPTVVRICQAVNSVRALTVLLLIQYEEWDQLATLPAPNAELYDSSYAFADDYLVSSLLSKAEFLPTTIDRKAVAEKKFRASEEKCAETNRRILDPRSVFGCLQPGPFHSIIHRAKGHITKVLGPVRYDQVFDHCGWGPGVSSSVKGDATSVYNKFLGKPEITRDLLACGFHHVINGWHPWARSLLQSDGDYVSIIPRAMVEVKGSKLTFVPKNAKTDRSICVEPHLNSFLQKGIGSLIRRRLQKFGLDLDHGFELNRLKAKEGSISEAYATIDLSAASDTVSLELVRLLLPPDWFSLMDAARSKNGSYQGKWFRFHKFSSMGNGFTFELESLIFWALGVAVIDSDPSGFINVYGDDIVISSAHASDLINVLSHCGFEVNPDKTFLQGPFRESCGQDFFRGTLVRPFFIRKGVTNGEAICRLANALRRYASCRLNGMGCDSRFRAPWRYLVRQIPKSHLFRIPDGYGDGGVVCNFDESLPTVGASAIPAPLRLKDGVEGYAVRIRLTLPIRSPTVEYSASLLHSWMTSGSLQAGGYFTYRRRVRSRVGLITIRDWPDLGDWL